MSEPTPVKSHPESAKVRLPHFLQGAPNLGALVDVLAARHQRLDGVLFELWENRALSVALGAQLDALGTVLDLRRLVGQSDADYRMALQGRAGQLGRSGTPEVVIQTYKAIWQANSVLLGELQSATVELAAFVNADVSPGDDGIIATMDKVKAGGVQMILEVAEEPAFLWGDAALADTNGDLPLGAYGFGNAAQADSNGNLEPAEGGGNFARVLT